VQGGLGGSVMPQRATEDKMVLSGSAGLPVHAEMAGTVWRPSEVILSCWRAQKPASSNPVNTIVPVWSIVSKLTTDEIRLLSAPSFIVCNGLGPDSDVVPRPLIDYVRVGRSPRSGDGHPLPRCGNSRVIGGVMVTYGHGNRIPFPGGGRRVGRPR